MVADNANKGHLRHVNPVCLHSVDGKQVWRMKQFGKAKAIVQGA